MTQVMFEKRPHCFTEIESRASVCRGCGAEVVIGPRLIELILGGLISVFILTAFGTFPYYNNQTLPLLKDFGGVKDIVDAYKGWIFGVTFFIGMIGAWKFMRNKRRYFRRKNV